VKAIDCTTPPGGALVPLIEMAELPTLTASADMLFHTSPSTLHVIDPNFKSSLFEFAELSEHAVEPKIMTKASNIITNLLIFESPKIYYKAHLTL
jgi:hypothetical protein